MKIFVYRVDNKNCSNYLIYYQDDIYKWRFIGVEKCPTKKITRKFIRRYLGLLSSAPKGSIGKPSFSYGEESRKIYVLVQGYDIIL